jgi:hypothetical protein
MATSATGEKTRARVLNRVRRPGREWGENQQSGIRFSRSKRRVSHLPVRGAGFYTSGAGRTAGLGSTSAKAGRTFLLLLPFGTWNQTGGVGGTYSRSNRWGRRNVASEHLKPLRFLIQARGIRNQSRETENENESPLSSAWEWVRRHRRNTPTSMLFLFSVRFRYLRCISGLGRKRGNRPAGVTASGVK